MPMLQVGALFLYLAIGYLYVISGLAVPAPFLLSLWIAWAALLVIGLRHRDDLRYLVTIPLLAVTAWVAIVLGLGSLFNWQA